MIRLLALLLALTLPASAQNLTDDGRLLGQPIQIDRTATGGAQTVEDIMARQNALRVDDSERRLATGGAPRAQEGLGTVSGASDPDLWRAIRYDTANITSQQRGPASTTLIQTGGMGWLDFRMGPLQFWGAIALGAMLAVLLVFYLVRGRIRLSHPPTGRTVTRFRWVERFAHWVLGGSFILLAISGLLVLFGRKAIIPLIGHEAWSPIAIASKWIHNNVSWAFMIALVAVFVMWVVHNLPSRTDLRWIARGGGMFGGGHPPAKKFNAGQKLVFWSVIIFGASLSVSGLSLLFPFEFHLFPETLGFLNEVGVPNAIGMADFRTDLTPQEEMQYTAGWHAIVAFILIAIAMGHIYIGTIGMEGAFDAMGTGEVDEEWAREHHSIWAEKAIAHREARRRGARRGTAASATPAE